MYKKGVAADMTTIAFTLILFTVFFLSIVSCQELTATSRETRANDIIIEMESHEYLREFARLNTDILLVADFRKLENSAINFFDGFYEGFKLEILKEDRVIYEITDNDNCASTIKTSSIRFPTYDGIIDLTLFKRTGCEDKFDYTTPAYGGP